jgi:hypothetical protein
MHPDIQRDIDQKVCAGLITVKDSRLLLKYLEARQTIRGLTEMLFDKFVFVLYD